MAGESPDRSERERSSGETTGSGGTVARPDETAEKKQSKSSGAENGAGTATRDTAPSKIPAPTSPAGEPDDETGGRTADPEGTAERDEAIAAGEPATGDEGDARLKSAVAAWVAGDGAPADADGAEGQKTPANGADGAGVDARAGKNGDGAASSDLPVRPKSEDAQSDVDTDAGTAAEADSGPEADLAPQGDAPTAMFGIVRPGSDRSRQEDDVAAADRAERLTSAFFGAPKDAKSAGEDDKDDKSGKSGRNGGAADQPTAVFRTPDTKRGETKSPQSSQKPGKAEEPTKSEDGEKPEGGEKPEKSGRKGSADPSGAPDPRKWDGSDKGGSDKGSRDKGGSEESEAERTSQFVPLRSADEPRTPAKSTPSTPSTAAGATGAAAATPAAPGKPASSSPSAPTANPWSAAPARPAGAPQSPAAPGSAPGTSAGAADPSASAPAPAPAPAPSPAESEPERTRQQPMPGSPEAGGSQPQPLDLLAQLTNSPPPPETPLRTAARRVKIWTPLVLLLAVIFVVVQALRPLPDPELSMTAAGTYTFEGDKPSMPWPSEGQAVIDVDGLGSFGSHGKQKPVPIASVAKVMTAYVILRDHPVKKGTKGEMIPVDQKAEDEAGLSAQNESTVKVKAGQKISQREAMDAIMIASANNVARLLARWDAGSEKAFVKKMNAAAKDLGMTNTHYTDPSGLTASTVSTAADQVKLGKKVMESPLFREVVRQPQYVDTNGKKQSNWNRLVPMDGVVGIKTGTTTKAGGNLLFAAEKEIAGTKQLIIGAVLGQYQPSILDTVLAASKKLIDAGQDALTAKKVVKKGQVVGYVDDKLGGKTPVVATKDVTAVGWSGLKVKLKLTDSGKTIPHEAGPGTKVGSLTVGDGPGQVKVPVALQSDLTEPGFGDKLTRVG
ncbi:D-alanyl-D-alanine carboxypeptidase [Streptomyces spirodelae]|uniref:D-alanyl-D-alanine carboxypeptidase n=1 Tax=Streptomyces spirodelae TaxID=2812904 RepID=A0ABS3WTQ7_9ACTN|nr:serine hydrolase [Streptomyces spirodelae]MBO8186520.1 D-alanyl-D-alanine carboxypeptidase [Streptomyces spirodelae]